MAAPVNTYDSNTNLYLGQVPIGRISEDLYRELLDIHNAIEVFLTNSDAADAIAGLSRCLGLAPVLCLTLLFEGHS